MDMSVRSTIVVVHGAFRRRVELERRDRTAAADRLHGGRGRGPLRGGEADSASLSSIVKQIVLLVGHSYGGRR
jgi:hypothetical protein